MVCKIIYLLKLVDYRHIMWITHSITVTFWHTFIPISLQIVLKTTNAVQKGRYAGVMVKRVQQLVSSYSICTLSTWTSDFCFFPVNQMKQGSIFRVIYPQCTLIWIISFWPVIFFKFWIESFSIKMSYIRQCAIYRTNIVRESSLIAPPARFRMQTLDAKWCA